MFISVTVGLLFALFFQFGLIIQENNKKYWSVFGNVFMLMYVHVHAPVWKLSLPPLQAQEFLEGVITTVVNACGYLQMPSSFLNEMSIKGAVVH